MADLLRPVVAPREPGEVAEFLGVPLQGSSRPPRRESDFVRGVTLDSRRVEPGDLYAALPGFNTHGAAFSQAAVDAGAAAILTDPNGANRALATGIPVIVVDTPRARLGRVSAWIYGEPAEGMTMVGLTGTNGKTTTGHLIEWGLREAGKRTGIIGTVGTRIGEEYIPTTRTTPEAPDVHRLLAVMRERGVEAVVMEVSSHALALGRVDGIVFDHALFTNLSQDHLDFHRTMEEYFEAKASLFTPERARRGVICIDGEWGARMQQRSSIPAGTYSAAVGLEGSGHPTADWWAEAPHAMGDGSTRFTACGPQGLRLDAGVSLPGQYNIANALGAIATLIDMGMDPQAAATGVAACSGVPGRMERIISGQGFVAIVDYAHTPDAVERALAAVRENVTGRVIAVLGCGGDRDADKRPLMGEAAARGSDVFVVTDDNPRGESPSAIRVAIMMGAERVSGAVVHDIGDRARAIREAVALAEPGDAVVVLGKGHEQGQEVAGRMLPFDDRDELRRAIEELKP